MSWTESDEIKEKYYSRYLKYAFHPDKSRHPDQQTYKAVIRRLVHIIEKGLSMDGYQCGRGRDAVMELEDVMLNYSSAHDISQEFYQTGLCVLDEYIQRNKGCREQMADVVSKYHNLRDGGAEKNERAGILHKKASADEDYSKCNFKELLEKRHSVRHFSEKPVEKEKILEALEIAKHTPSACNRQGWKTYIIFDEETKRSLLANQNGNKGFGEEIKTLLAVTYDIRFTSIDREAFQGFIDGGMYLMGLLCALQYCNLASVPLSASLHIEQETLVRNMLGMEEQEILIGFIGAGDYAEEYEVTKSFRDRPNYVIV